MGSEAHVTDGIGSVIHNLPVDSIVEKLTVLWFA
jgi:hypothetical protein